MQPCSADDSRDGAESAIGDLELTMLHGFVHEYGGHATIRHERGRGTTIAIYLPRYVEETSPLLPSSTA
jgi:signal transduction histidine kinase